MHKDEKITRGLIKFHSPPLLAQIYWGRHFCSFSFIGKVLFNFPPLPDSNDNEVEIEKDKWIDR